MTMLEFGARGLPPTGVRPGHATSAPVVHVAGRTVVPVLDGDRPVGVYVVTDDARWYPVCNHRHGSLTAGAVAVAAAAGAAAAVVSNQTRAVRQITMGPGGWVSFRGTRPPRRLGPPALHGRARWAHLRRAPRATR